MYITHNIPHLYSESILITNKKTQHIFIVCSSLRHLTSHLIISECAISVYLFGNSCDNNRLAPFRLRIQKEIPDLVTWLTCQPLTSGCVVNNTLLKESVDLIQSLVHKCF